jgi:hypothetical protein
MSNFSAISWWNNDDVLIVLDQHAELDFYSASSLKQQSSGRHVAPLWEHYSDSGPNSFCSYSLMSPWYNWNIVESGVKHHKTKPTP